MRVRRFLLGIVVAVLAFSGTSGLAGEFTVDRPAIPLFTPSPTTPDAARDSRVMPKTRLNPTIDENGRVTKLAVLQLDPPSEHDVALKQAIEAAVKTWRFGPALKGRTRVATEQELTVSFVTAGSHPSQPEPLASAAGAADEQDDQTYRQRAAGQLYSGQRIAGRRLGNARASRRWDRWPRASRVRAASDPRVAAPCAGPRPPPWAG